MELAVAANYMYTNLKPTCGLWHLV